MRTNANANANANTNNATRRTANTNTNGKMIAIRSDKNFIDIRINKKSTRKFIINIIDFILSMLTVMAVIVSISFPCEMIERMEFSLVPFIITIICMVWISFVGWIYSK